MKTKHTHRAVPEFRQELPFVGAVVSARQHNPAAHGGLLVRDTCRCSATRLTNVNGRHIERGRWYGGIEEDRCECRRTPQERADEVNMLPAPRTEVFERDEMWCTECGYTVRGGRS